MERLIFEGKLPVVSADKIPFSRLGIGFEKLDRDTFDPNKAYDKLAAIGVKQVRIQSGWARCEKEKGVYDFGWLDAIVDNIRSRGMEPWLDLCYGNPLYTDLAKPIFGAVGCGGRCALRLCRCGRRIACGGRCGGPYDDDCGRYVG